MITEDYVSYEIAKLLKEKGFDAETNTYYYATSEYTKSEMYKSPNNTNWNNNEYYYSAPTHQMAMKWLREVHNIFILIEPHSYNYIEEKNSSYVFSFWQGDNYCENPLLKEYYSYKDTVEAALKYSLENLI